MTRTLKDYARHDRECVAWTNGFGAGCTCGLSTLLAQTPDAPPTPAMADDTLTPPTVESIVDEMLTLYGVPFTDATSRTVAVETWARLIAAVRAENNATTVEQARAALDDAIDEVRTTYGDSLPSLTVATAAKDAAIDALTAAVERNAAAHSDEYYLAMAALDVYPIGNDGLLKSTSVVYRIHQLGTAYRRCVAELLALLDERSEEERTRNGEV